MGPEAVRVGRSWGPRSRRAHSGGSRAGGPPAAGTLVDHILIQHRSAGNAPHTVVVPPDTPAALRCELDVLSVAQVQPPGVAPRREDGRQRPSSEFDCLHQCLPARAVSVHAQGNEYVRA